MPGRPPASGDGGGVVGAGVVGVGVVADAPPHPQSSPSCAILRRVLLVRWRARAILVRGWKTAGGLVDVQGDVLMQKQAGVWCVTWSGCLSRFLWICWGQPCCCWGQPCRSCRCRAVLRRRRLGVCVEQLCGPSEGRASPSCKLGVRRAATPDGFVWRASERRRRRELKRTRAPLLGADPPPRLSPTPFLLIHTNKQQQPNSPKTEQPSQGGTTKTTTKSPYPRPACNLSRSLDSESVSARLGYECAPTMGLCASVRFICFREEDRKETGVSSHTRWVC